MLAAAVATHPMRANATGDCGDRALRGDRALIIYRTVLCLTKYWPNRRGIKTNLWPPSGNKKEVWGQPSRPRKFTVFCSTAIRFAKQGLFFVPSYTCSPYGRMRTEVREMVHTQDLFYYIPTFPKPWTLDVRSACTRTRRRLRARWRRWRATRRATWGWSWARRSSSSGTSGAPLHA
jgi:hypothetical protein